MANGQFKFGKPSGGSTTVSMTDGASNTNLVLPESGTVATQAYADGKTTLAQVKAEISTGSNLVTSPTGTIGYGTGSGGTVTQLTSKSTTVTLNKPSGVIIMNSAALAAGAYIEFLLNNTSIQTTDTVELNIVSGLSAGGGSYSLYKVPVPNGCYIGIRNETGASLSDSLMVKFNVIKGANS